MSYTPISVTAAKERMDSGWSPYVLDVRSQAEADAQSLPFVDARQTHTEVLGIAEDLPKDRDILVHCKRGGRSAMACRALAAAGFTQLFNLEGGITAWADEIDPSL